MKSLNISISFPDDAKSKKVKVFISTRDTSYGTFDMELDATSPKSIEQMWQQIRELSNDTLKELQSGIE